MDRTGQWGLWLLCALLVVSALPSVLSQAWDDRHGHTPGPGSGTGYGQQSGSAPGDRLYQSGYDTRRYPIDPNFRPSLAKTPVDYKRYQHSDSRCMEDILTYTPEEIATVNTKYGKVTGRYSYLCDMPGLSERNRPVSTPNLDFHTYRPRAKVQANVTMFLGIPYAKPPTKERRLRFKAPQPPPYWGAIEAIEYKPSCPQPLKYTGLEKMIPRIDEDCLYMNIFSPFVSSQLNEPYPVMMHIHDGNFEHGSGNTFPGHMLAVSQRVVVVTFNYRLGLLGFFATADNASAGNYGMLDQVQALTWIRENIRFFNGDPDQITVFGPGAGAISGGLLALSPLSRKYVKRVIAQSGSAVSEWGISKDYITIRNMSIVAGYSYGCRTFHTFKLVECLESRSYSDVSITTVKPDVGWLPWSPVPDFRTRPPESRFMPEVPEFMLENGVNFAPDFAYLTGVTRDEGAAILLQDEEVIRNGYSVDKQLFDRKVEAYIKIFNATLSPDDFLSAIKFMYTPWTDSSNETLMRQGLVDLITDSWYVSGVDKMVKLLLKNNVKTYMYVLNYTIEGLDWPEWRGAPHDAEYFLASGAPFMDPKFFPTIHGLEKAKWTDADRNMSEFFMKSWANFAREGNPTPQRLFNTIYWKPMSLKTLQYLSVNTTNYTSIMHRDYKQKQCQFWNNYIPKLAKRPPFYWPPTYEPIEVELRIYRAATWAILAALVLLIFLTLLCSCLYCRAKRDRFGDAALEDFLPNIQTMATQYSAPSTRANSEMSLSSRGRIDPYPQPHKTVTVKGAKYNKVDNKTNAAPKSSKFVFRSHPASATD